MITGSAKIAGVLGWPIGHSLSPLLHGYWLREHGIDGAYVPLAVQPQDFAMVIDGLRRAGFAGVNVTVPHKEAAFALAHAADAAAVAAGAANLLLFQNGRIEVRNTDIEGLAQSLKPQVTLAGKTAVLLGTGGAARAAVMALAGLGASTIHILGRDEKRAASLASALGSQVKAALKPGALESWNAVAGQAALLVNATSAGMNGNAPLALDLSPLPAGAAVCDLVYKPLQTELLKAAAARGLKTIDGLGMLMHQAAPSFAGFYGVTPQVTPGLRAHLEQTLEQAL